MKQETDDQKYNNKNKKNTEETKKTRVKNKCAKQEITTRTVKIEWQTNGFRHMSFVSALQKSFVLMI